MPERGGCRREEITLVDDLLPVGGLGRGDSKGGVVGRKNFNGSQGG